MKIGCPKEIKNQEHRVGLIPATVKELTKLGHSVFIQESAGIGSGFSDSEYESAGAQILSNAAKVFYIIYMIKNKDVVVDRQGRIFQVVDADYRTDRLGKQILCRLYRSQKRFAFMPWQVKKHPFFS